MDGALTHHPTSSTSMLSLGPLSPLARLLFSLALVLGLSNPATPTFSQNPEPPKDETLLQGVQSSGGYGAPTVALTTVNGEAVAVVGGQGGWILNRRFVIGGAGRGITPLPDLSLPDTPGSPAQLQLGYGGLLLEYIGAPSELVHYGTQVVVGGGSVQLVDADYDPRNGESLDRSAVFAAEAGARVELNVTRFFRVGLSGGYRLISGSDLERASLSDSDLSAPFGQLSLRFGRF